MYPWNTLAGAVRHGTESRSRETTSEHRLWLRGEFCEKLVDLLCYYQGLWNRPGRNAYGRECRNLPAGGQYNVSAGSGENNGGFPFQAYALSARENHSRQTFPREGARAHARGEARRPFDFAWAAQLGQSSDELNAYLHIIARETARYRSMKIDSPPRDEWTESSRWWTYLLRKWAPSDEILLNVKYDRTQFSVICRITIAASLVRWSTRGLG